MSQERGDTTSARTHAAKALDRPRTGRVEVHVSVCVNGYTAEGDPFYEEACTMGDQRTRRICSHGFPGQGTSVLKVPELGNFRLANFNGISTGLRRIGHVHLPLSPSDCPFATFSPTFFDSIQRTRIDVTTFLVSGSPEAASSKILSSGSCGFPVL